MAVPSVPPRATYRLQLHPGFDFDRAIEVLDYLVELGVSHCYFAPYLASIHGSAHGYDVVDPSSVREDLGGEAGHERLCQALRARGLSHMVDVVPNHMGIESEANDFWWDVLAEGRTSRFAHMFDIDWDADPDGLVVLPILPCEPDEALSTGYVHLTTREGRAALQVGPRALPLRAGSVEATQGDLASLLARQHYRLLHFRTGLARMNYRRFLDVGALAAIRVEDPGVFRATHARILDWVREGKVSAIRVDHPDGLSDPEGYFRDLRAAAPGAWLLGEKVLSPGEWLPENWAVDGTTGYEFLNLLNGLFVDPRSADALDQVAAEFTGAPVQPVAEILREGKRLAIDVLLVPEVERVARLACALAPDLDHGRARAAVSALTLALEVGRSYARPGDALSATERGQLTRARERAERDHPELARDIERLAELIARPPVGELCLRFQQLTSAAMAKGIEDTALYRTLRLVSLNEVGSDLAHFGHSVREFHLFCQRATHAQPLSLLCTSTHDTKRSEDTRLRIDVLSELPAEWAEAVRTFHALNASCLAPGVDRATEYFLYQTLVGTHPISEERLSAYMLKAVREAKLHTSWLARDVGYEAAVIATCHAVLKNREFLAALDAFLVPVLRAARVHALTQTLLKVTCPGIPDVYQGTELWDESLVDPDNRRAVDFTQRRTLLAELRRGLTPAEILARRDEGLPKLWVLAQALALRAERPASLSPTARYEPLAVEDDAREGTLAFLRGGDVLVVAPRLAHVHGQEPSAARLTLPQGSWLNRLTGERHGPGDVAVSTLLAQFPVALLVRD